MRVKEGGTRAARSEQIPGQRRSPAGEGHLERTLLVCTFQRTTRESACHAENQRTHHEEARFSMG